jgi:DNA-binding LacI/PurR family transcriptional regulator
LQNLLADLRRQIAVSFAPGEMLPPKRELASMHGVSPSTIQNAMRVLTREGSVQVRPRVGCIRPPLPQASTAGGRGKARRRVTVGIMTPRERDEWPDYQLYPGLLAEAANRGMDVIEIPHRFGGRRRSTPGRWRVEMARVPWNLFDVGLLVEAENTIKHAAPYMKGRKVVVVDMDATEHGIASAAFADAQAGTLAARHLLELGHVYFAVTEDCNAPGFAWDDAWTKRRQSFEAAVGQAGGVIAPRWRMPVPRQGGIARIREFLSNELPPVVKTWVSEPVERRPTALFIHALNVLEPIVAELARYGLRVPQDLSVITVSCDMRRLNYGQGVAVGGMRLTSVDVDTAALARRTLDAVEDIVRNKNAGERNAVAKLYLAPGVMLIGQSTVRQPRN